MTSEVAKDISFFWTFSIKENFFEKMHQNPTKATFFNDLPYFAKILQIFENLKKIRKFHKFYVFFCIFHAWSDMMTSEVAKDISFFWTFSRKKNFVEKMHKNTTKTTFFSDLPYFTKILQIFENVKKI